MSDERTTPRWEYKLIRVLDRGTQADVDATEAMLNSLGAKGWECYHVGGVLWLKRQL